MMQNFPTWKEALYRQVLFIFRATKHIYEEIDNLHINYHYIYSEELLSPFANSNKTTGFMNIELDEKMRCYKT